jgi:hypothetical protein
LGMTASDRSLRARQGGYSKAAQYDPREYTKPARDAFLARFEPDDPEGLLSPEERRRRAIAARKAYMISLARKSAAARRRV